ncbi:hypothetical protein SANTM175S_07857 [Streptomyces antimycoticus]
MTSKSPRRAGRDPLRRDPRRRRLPLQRLHRHPPRPRRRCGRDLPRRSPAHLRPGHRRRRHPLDTRGLAFGPEEPYHRDLGHSFAGFTMPNHLGLAHEGQRLDRAGQDRRPLRTATATGCTPSSASCAPTRPSTPSATPPPSATSWPGRSPDTHGRSAHGRRPARQRRPLLRRGQPDPYATVVHGRVALVGDAAYAPSFFSGQGWTAWRWSARTSSRASFAGAGPCRCLREVRARPDGRSWR